MRFLLCFHFVCFCLWGRLNMTHGNNDSLKCYNDYIYTIMCELNMTSKSQPSDALYWLEFYDYRGPFECMLTRQSHSWVCVLNLSTRVEFTFMDTDLFQISLNHSFHGNNGSEVLETNYMPVNYIRPVPPSNLTLLWKPDEAVFQWSNSYNQMVMFIPTLKYQLRILSNGKVMEVHSHLTNVSVPTSAFAPDTTYEAQVRSAPDEVDYKGVWSHWGPAIHWTTLDAPDMSYTTVCLAVFLLPAILLFYFLYTRWKRCVLNPSPAPHIGDFKCLAMLPENVSELLKREESLQIDILTEVDSAPQMKPTQYISTSSTNDDTSFAGSLRCSSMLQSSVGSKISMNSWMQALMSAEKGSVMYSDDYCTLSHAIIEHAVKTHKI